MNWIPFFTELGQQSLTYIWVPLGLWTLAAIPVYFISRLLGRRHPLMHYQGLLALLLALPVGIALMPVVSQFIPGTQIPVVSDWVDIPATQLPIPEAEIKTDVLTGEALQDKPLADASTLQFPALTEANAGQPIQPEPGLANAPHPNWLTWLGVVTLIAFMLSFLSLLRLGVNLIRLNVLRSYLVPATGQLSVLNDLAESLNIRRPIFLAYNPVDTSPMTFGWLRPVISIPAELEGDSRALRVALLHELIHVRRNDFLWGLISRFIGAAFVFHPGIWWINRELNLYRELSCDTDTLASQSYSSADYARLLVNLNSALSPHPSPSIAISMIHRQSSLKKRIKHMTRSVYQYPTALRFIVVLTFLLLPALLVACSSNQANGSPDSITEADQRMAVEKLAAEVEYLREETMALNAQMDTLVFQMTHSNDELQRAAYEREHKFQQNRYFILDGMLWRKVEALEEAKVDLIGGAMVTGIN